MIVPVLYGCQGTQLLAGEAAFFRKAQPLGLIVFARNIDTPEQLKQLVADFLACIDHPYAMVLIDQEGGRVQRLQPPHWPRWPKAATLGQVYTQDQNAGIALAQATAKTLASTLTTCGIIANAAPVLDVHYPYGHQVIGDRALHSNPETITKLGRILVDGFLASGVLPIIKHIPGHGRSQSDSHLALPIVDASEQELLATDCHPFIQLADAPAAMTAHIVFPAIDQEHPVTLSAQAMHWLRERLGYTGLIISDCLHMKALQGSIESIAQQAQAAGVDVMIDSHSDLASKKQVRQALQPASQETEKRLERAFAAISKTPEPPSKQDWQLIQNWAEKEAVLDPTIQHFIDG